MELMLEDTNFVVPRVRISTQPMWKGSDSLQPHGKPKEALSQLPSSHPSPEQQYSASGSLSTREHHVGCRKDAKGWTT